MLVFLPGESQGWRSLVGYSPWGHEELDMTEMISLSQSQEYNFLNSERCCLMHKTNAITCISSADNYISIDSADSYTNVDYLSKTQFIWNIAFAIETSEFRFVIYNIVIRTKGF